MNIIKITINDLLDNKARTIALVTMISAMFCIFFIILTLREGMNGQMSFVAASRLHVKSRLPQYPLLPIRYADKLKTIQGINSVSYFVGIQGRTGNDDTPFQVLFVPPEGTFDVYPDFRLSPEHKEKWQSTRSAAVVGADLARRRGWKVGDIVPITTHMLNVDGTPIWEFEIAGIYETELSPPYTEFFLGNYDYYNEYVGDPSSRSMVYQYLIRVDDPQKTKQIAAAIDNEFKTDTHQTLTMSQREEALAYIEQFADIAKICVIVGVAAFFSLMFVLITSIKMIFEKKRRDIAVLNCIGFSVWKAACIILAEGAMIVLPGFTAGALVSALFVAIAGPHVRALLETFYINTDVFINGIFICIIVLILITFPAIFHLLRFRLSDELRR